MKRYVSKATLKIKQLPEKCVEIKNHKNILTDRSNMGSGQFPSVIAEQENIMIGKGNNDGIAYTVISAGNDINCTKNRGDKVEGESNQTSSVLSKQNHIIGLKLNRNASGKLNFSLSTSTKSDREQGIKRESVRKNTKSGRSPLNTKSGRSPLISRAESRRSLVSRAESRLPHVSRAEENKRSLSQCSTDSRIGNTALIERKQPPDSTQQDKRTKSPSYITNRGNKNAVHVERKRFPTTGTQFKKTKTTEPGNVSLKNVSQQPVRKTNSMCIGFDQKVNKGMDLCVNVRESSGQTSNEELTDETDNMEYVCLDEYSTPSLIVLDVSQKHLDAETVGASKRTIKSNVDIINATQSGRKGNVSSIMQTDAHCISRSITLKTDEKTSSRGSERGQRRILSKKPSLLPLIKTRPALNELVASKFLTRNKQDSGQNRTSKTNSVSKKSSLVARRASLNSYGRTNIKNEIKQNYDLNTESDVYKQSKIVNSVVLPSQRVIKTQDDKVYINNGQNCVNSVNECKQCTQEVRCAFNDFQVRLPVQKGIKEYDLNSTETDWGNADKNLIQTVLKSFNTSTGSKTNCVKNCVISKTKNGLINGPGTTLIPSGGGSCGINDTGGADNLNGRTLIQCHTSHGPSSESLGQEFISNLQSNCQNCACRTLTSDGSDNTDSGRPTDNTCVLEHSDNSSPRDQTTGRSNELYCSKVDFNLDHLSTNLTDSLTNPSNLFVSTQCAEDLSYDLFNDLNTQTNSVLNYLPACHNNINNTYVKDKIYNTSITDCLEDIDSNRCTQSSNTRQKDNTTCTQCSAEIINGIKIIDKETETKFNEKCVKFKLKDRIKESSNEIIYTMHRRPPQNCDSSATRNANICRDLSRRSTTSVSKNVKVGNNDKDSTANKRASLQQSGGTKTVKVNSNRISSASSSDSKRDGKLDNTKLFVKQNSVQRNVGCKSLNSQRCKSTTCSNKKINLDGIRNVRQSESHKTIKVVSEKVKPPVSDIDTSNRGATGVKRRSIDTGTLLQISNVHNNDTRENNTPFKDQLTDIGHNTPIGEEKNYCKSAKVKSSAYHDTNNVITFTEELESGNVGFDQCGVQGSETPLPVSALSSIDDDAVKVTNGKYLNSRCFSKRDGALLTDNDLCKQPSSKLCAVPFNLDAGCKENNAIGYSEVSFLSACDRNYRKLNNVESLCASPPSAESNQSVHYECENQTSRISLDNFTNVTNSGFDKEIENSSLNQRLGYTRADDVSNYGVFVNECNEGVITSDKEDNWRQAMDLLPSSATITDDFCDCKSTKRINNETIGGKITNIVSNDSLQTHKFENSKIRICENVHTENSEKLAKVESGYGNYIINDSNCSVSNGNDHVLLHLDLDNITRYHTDEQGHETIFIHKETSYTSEYEDVSDDVCDIQDVKTKTNIRELQPGEINILSTDCSGTHRKVLPTEVSAYTYRDNRWKSNTTLSKLHVNKKVSSINQTYKNKCDKIEQSQESDVSATRSSISRSRSVTPASLSTDNICVSNSDYKSYVTSVEDKNLVDKNNGYNNKQTGLKGPRISKENVRMSSAASLKQHNATGKSRIPSASKSSKTDNARQQIKNNDNAKGSNSSTPSRSPSTSKRSSARISPVQRLSSGNSSRSSSKESSPISTGASGRKLQHPKSVGNNDMKHNSSNSHDKQTKGQTVLTTETKESDASKNRFTKAENSSVGSGKRRRSQMDQKCSSSTKETSKLGDVQSKDNKTLTNKEKLLQKDIKSDKKVREQIPGASKPRTTTAIPRKQTEKEQSYKGEIKSAIPTPNGNPVNLNRLAKKDSKSGNTISPPFARQDPGIITKSVPGKQSTRVLTLTRQNVQQINRLSRKVSESDKMSTKSSPALSRKSRSATPLDVNNKTKVNKRASISSRGSSIITSRESSPVMSRNSRSTTPSSGLNNTNKTLSSKIGIRHVPSKKLPLQSPNESTNIGKNTTGMTSIKPVKNATGMTSTKPAVIATVMTSTKSAKNATGMTSKLPQNATGMTKSVVSGEKTVPRSTADAAASQNNSSTNVKYGRTGNKQSRQQSTTTINAVNRLASPKIKRASDSKTVQTHRDSLQKQSTNKVRLPRTSTPSVNKSKPVISAGTQKIKSESKKVSESESEQSSKLESGLTSKSNSEREIKHVEVSDNPCKSSFEVDAVIDIDVAEDTYSDIIRNKNIPDERLPSLMPIYRCEMPETDTDIKGEQLNHRCDTPGTDTDTKDEQLKQDEIFLESHGLHTDSLFQTGDKESREIIDIPTGDINKHLTKQMVDNEDIKTSYNEDIGFYGDEESECVNAEDDRESDLEEYWSLSDDDNDDTVVEMSHELCDNKLDEKETPCTDLQNIDNYPPSNVSGASDSVKSDTEQLQNQLENVKIESRHVQQMHSGESGKYNMHVADDFKTKCEVFEIENGGCIYGQMEDFIPQNSYLDQQIDKDKYTSDLQKQNITHKEKCDEDLEGLLINSSEQCKKLVRYNNQYGVEDYEGKLALNTDLDVYEDEISDNLQTQMFVDSKGVYEEKHVKDEQAAEEGGNITDRMSHLSSSHIIQHQNSTDRTPSESKTTLETQVCSSALLTVKRDLASEDSAVLNRNLDINADLTAEDDDSIKKQTTVEAASENLEYSNIECAGECLELENQILEENNSDEHLDSTEEVLCGDIHKQCFNCSENDTRQLVNENTIHLNIEGDVPDTSITDINSQCKTETSFKDRECMSETCSNLETSNINILNLANQHESVHDADKDLCNIEYDTLNNSRNVKYSDVDDLESDVWEELDVENSDTIMEHENDISGTKYVTYSVKTKTDNMFGKKVVRKRRVAKYETVFKRMDEKEIDKTGNMDMEITNKPENNEIVENNYSVIEATANDGICVSFSVSLSDDMICSENEKQFGETTECDNEGDSGKHVNVDDNIHSGEFSEHINVDDNIHSGEFSEHINVDDNIHSGEFSEHTGGHTFVINGTYSDTDEDTSATLVQAVQQVMSDNTNTSYTVENNELCIDSVQELPKHKQLTVCSNEENLSSTDFSHHKDGGQSTCKSYNENSVITPDLISDKTINSEVVVQSETQIQDFDSGLRYGEANICDFNKGINVIGQSDALDQVYNLDTSNFTKNGQDSNDSNSGVITKNQRAVISNIDRDNSDNRTTDGQLNKSYLVDIPSVSNISDNNDVLQTSISDNDTIFVHSEQCLTTPEVTSMALLKTRSSVCDYFDSEQTDENKINDASFEQTDDYCVTSQAQLPNNKYTDNWNEKSSKAGGETLVIKDEKSIQNKTDLEDQRDLNNAKHSLVSQHPLIKGDNNEVISSAGLLLLRNENVHTDYITDEDNGLRENNESSASQPTPILNCENSKTTDDAENHDISYQSISRQNLINENEKKSDVSTEVNVSEDVDVIMIKRVNDDSDLNTNQLDASDKYDSNTTDRQVDIGVEIDVADTDKIGSKTDNQDTNRSDPNQVNTVQNDIKDTKNKSVQRRDTGRNSIRRHTTNVCLTETSFGEGIDAEKPRARSKSPIGRTVKKVPPPSCGPGRVSEICKAFIKRASKSAGVKSPERPLSPEPKLTSPSKKLKWVKDCGSWKRIPVDEVVNVTLNATDQNISTQIGHNTFTENFTEEEPECEVKVSVRDIANKWQSYKRPSAARRTDVKAHTVLPESSNTGEGNNQSYVSNSKDGLTILSSGSGSNTKHDVSAKEKAPAPRIPPKTLPKPFISKAAKHTLINDVSSDAAFLVAEMERMTDKLLHDDDTVKNNMSPGDGQGNSMERMTDRLLHDSDTANDNTQPRDAQSNSLTEQIDGHQQTDSDEIIRQSDETNTGTGIGLNDVMGTGDDMDEFKGENKNLDGSNTTVLKVSSCLVTDAETLSAAQPHQKENIRYDENMISNSEDQDAGISGDGISALNPSCEELENKVSSTSLEIRDDGQSDSLVVDSQNYISPEENKTTLQDVNEVNIIAGSDTCEVTKNTDMLQKPSPRTVSSSATNSTSDGTGVSGNKKVNEKFGLTKSLMAAKPYTPNFVIDIRDPVISPTVSQGDGVDGCTSDMSPSKGTQKIKAVRIKQEMFPKEESGKDISDDNKRFSHKERHKMQKDSAEWISPIKQALYQLKQQENVEQAKNEPDVKFYISDEDLTSKSSSSNGNGHFGSYSVKGSGHFGSSSVKSHDQSGTVKTISHSGNSKNTGNGHSGRFFDKDAKMSSLKSDDELPLPPSCDSSGMYVYSGALCNSGGAMLANVDYDNNAGEAMYYPRSPGSMQKQLLSEILELEETITEDSTSSSYEKQNSEEESLSPCLTPTSAKHDPDNVRKDPRPEYRRSQSLPTGSLLRNDHKIYYKNGHFILDSEYDKYNGINSDIYDHTENFVREERDQHSKHKFDFDFHEKMKFKNYEKVVDSENAFNEELHYSDDEADVFAENDGNVTVIDTDSSITSPQSDSCLSTVHRRTPTSDDDGQNQRPLSMDENQLESFVFEYEYKNHVVRNNRNTGMKNRRSASFKDISECRPKIKIKRNSSFKEAQEKGSLHENRYENMTPTGTHKDDLQQKSPGFLQRLLSKRKSVSEKGSSAKTIDQSKDSNVRKKSLRNLFLGKKGKDNNASTPNFSSEPCTPGTPPIATFKNDMDIHIIESAPNSPFSNRPFRRRHTSADIYSQGIYKSSQDVSSGYRPQRLKSDDQISVQSLVVNSGMDQPLRPKSPKPTGVTITRRNSSLSLHSSPHKDVSFEIGGRTDGECGSMCSLASSNIDNVTSITFDPSSSRQQFNDKPQNKGFSDLVQGEMTYSNSNDSGIQHDVSAHSSNESLRTSHDSTSSSSSVIRRRKSPSPRPERPKSEISVRWADLVETTEITPVKYREGSQKNKQRPISDLDDNLELFDEMYGEIMDDYEYITGGSTLSSDMKSSFGSQISLQPYSSLQNLEKLKRQDSFESKPCKRRMSTPHPIKSRQKQATPRQKKHHTSPLVRSHSMPESLDKLHKKKKLYITLGSSNLRGDLLHGGDDDSSSDDGSDISIDRMSLHEKSMSARSSNIQLATLDEASILYRTYDHIAKLCESDIFKERMSLHEKSLSARSSNIQLATLDEISEVENLIFAEALWDHITMDPEELGFRAGDVIEVMDNSNKDWWWGAVDDKDGLREGWFPATFVRLRVNQEQIEEELATRLHEVATEHKSPKLRRISVINPDQARENVVNEIINAEREYVKHLKDVVEGYVRHARKRTDMFSEERISVMFGNIEEIYDFSNRFLESLESAFIEDNPHLSELGQCFLEHSKEFEIYSDYCNNHPSASEELKESYRKQKYRHFFEACRLLQEMIEIPLEGFLLTPVQKICKYPLQLAELLKYTSATHPDYSNVKAALESMKKSAALINERKRKMESIEKLANWQQTVEDWQGSDLLEKSSELIISAEANKINSAGWSQERFFFLFDHQLIYCKKDLLKKNGYSYKGRIDMDQCEIIPVEDGKDQQYNVTVKNAWKIHETVRDKWYLLFTKTAAEKQRWLNAYNTERQRVREDQENNFVPVYWKRNILNKLKANKAKHNASRNTVPADYSRQFIRGMPSHATLPRSFGKKHQEKKKGWFIFGKQKSK